MKFTFTKSIDEYIQNKMSRTDSEQLNNLIALTMVQQEEIQKLEEKLAKIQAKYKSAVKIICDIYHDYPAQICRSCGEWEYEYKLHQCFHVYQPCTEKIFICNKCYSEKKHIQIKKCTKDNCRCVEEKTDCEVCCRE